MEPWGSRGDRRRRRARVGASYQAATGRRRGAPPLRARRARNPDAGAGGEGAVAGLADGAAERGEAEATAMTGGAWWSGRVPGSRVGFGLLGGGNGV